MKRLPNWVFVAIVLTLLYAAFVLPGDWKDPWNYGPTLSMIALLLLMGWIQNKYSSASRLVNNFIFPMLLGGSTLLLGTIAFYQTANYETLGDSFFGAANLITLNASELNGIAVPDRQGILILARTLGGITAVYAFILAFSLAAGRESMDRFKFWLFRKTNLRRSPKNFIVIIGDGMMALHLALNLEQEVRKGKEHRKVLLLSNQAGAVLKNKAIWSISGNLTDKNVLKKAYFWMAQEVYVLSDDDEVNFQIAQELHQLSEEKGKKKTGKWYLHQQDLRQRNLIHGFSKKFDHQFGIYENVIRKMMQDHSISHFAARKKYAKQGSLKVIILGFNAIAEQLAIHCLRIGHFESDKSMQLLIYYQAAEKEAVDNFRAKYPAVFRNSPLFDKALPANKKRIAAQRYAFPTIEEEEIIQFDLLPDSESDRCDKNWSFYSHIGADSICSIYSCQSSRLKSAALLSSLMPRMEYLQSQAPNHIDVQVFCGYGPNEDAELQSNKVTKHTFRSALFKTDFGNIAAECNAATIRNEPQDRSAKNIALLFDVIYQGPSSKNFKLAAKDPIRRSIEFVAAKKKDKVEEQAKNNVWQRISENHRASNRHAADHAIIKQNMLLPSGDSALQAFKQKVQEIWALEDLNDTQRYEKLFAELGDIPNLPEIEHRRWVATNLIDGFSPLEDNDKWQWADSKKRKLLKAQKIHADLVPFEELGWELEGDEDHWEAKSKDVSGVYGLV